MKTFTVKTERNNGSILSVCINGRRFEGDDIYKLVMTGLTEIIKKSEEIESKDSLFHGAICNEKTYVIC